MTSISRRLTALFAAAVFAALSVPSAASAAPPSQTTDAVHAVRFGPIHAAGATLEGHVGFSTLEGARAGLVYDGPLGLIYGVTGWAERDGNHLVGDLYLIDETGESPGWATYELDFTPAGPEEASERIVRDGNHRIVSNFTQQPMLVNGAITMHDGTVFPVVDAAAELNTQELWITGPEAIILDGHETFVDASWRVGDMDVIFRLNVTALDSRGAVIISTPDDPEIIGTAQPEIVDDRVSTDYTLERMDRSVAGTASSDLAIATLGSTASFEEDQLMRRRLITDEIVVFGDLTVVLDGTTYELSMADAALVTYRYAWHGLQYPFAQDGEG